MKNILLLSLISLLSHFSFGQLEFEQILGTEKHEIIWIYESYKGKDDSIFYKVEDKGSSLLIVFGQLYPDSLECETAMDSLIYKMECKFDEDIIYGSDDWYVSCTQLTVESNCEACQNGLLDYFILSAAYCNWLKTKEGSFISTKSNGSEKSKGIPRKIIYREASLKNGVFALEEKLMDKKEWKAYVKTLNPKS
jgi:hypothetical protein